MQKSLRTKVASAGVGFLWRIWKEISKGAIGEITEEASRPFQLALVGTPDQTRLLAARLALESPQPHNLPDGPADITSHTLHSCAAPPEQEGIMALDADFLTENETRLAQALAQIVLDHADLRLALACHIPAFRPAVSAQLIQEAALQNAKIAVISALPGVIPFTDIFLPLTAAGDVVALTRNQVVLLLKIAAAYGRDVDLRARVRELLPVVGSAFGWRALARELLGLVPGGIGVVIKGAVAYAGTYTVGKGAAIYYSTGRSLSESRLRQLYRDSFKEALSRLRPYLRFRRSATAAAANDFAPTSGPD
jgi:uncharacterized protein (DUF697 family)